MVDFWGDVLLREYARNSKQRVVVTGGAGFRGPHLGERLVGEGRHVICVDNFQKGRWENVSDLLVSGRFELIDHDIITPFGSRIPQFDQIDIQSCLPCIATALPSRSRRNGADLEPGHPAHFAWAARRRHPRRRPHSRESFEHMRRVAKVFCSSDLIPAHLKKNNGADALLPLQIAKRMNEDPVSVMQNIYFVSGKAGWSASYMIARANRNGVFKSPIRWKSTGAGDDLLVTARGRLAEIEGEDVELSVPMAMAQAEKRTSNSKYNNPMMADR